MEYYSSPIGVSYWMVAQPTMIILMFILGFLRVKLTKSGRIRYRFNRGPLIQLSAFFAALLGLMVLAESLHELFGLVTETFRMNNGSAAYILMTCLLAIYLVAFGYLLYGTSIVATSIKEEFIYNK